jgi:hypothetical protein
MLAERLEAEKLAAEKGTTVVKDYVLANAKDYPTLAASMGF